MIDMSYTKEEKRAIVSKRNAELLSKKKAPKKSKVLEKTE